MIRISCSRRRETREFSLRAFSGKVGTGFPQKMRQNQKPRSLSDSIESESDLARGTDRSLATVHAAFVAREIAVQAGDANRRLAGLLSHHVRRIHARAVAPARQFTPRPCPQYDQRPYPSSVMHP
jgi:hypothetical protein